MPMFMLSCQWSIPE